MPANNTLKAICFSVFLILSIQHFTFAHRHLINTFNWMPKSNNFVMWLKWKWLFTALVTQLGPSINGNYLINGEILPPSLHFSSFLWMEIIRFIFRALSNVRVNFIRNGIACGVSFPLSISFFHFWLRRASKFAEIRKDTWTKRMKTLAKYLNAIQYNRMRIFCPFIGSSFWWWLITTMKILKEEVKKGKTSQNNRMEDIEEDESSLRQKDMLYYTRVSIKRQQHLQNFIDANRRTTGFKRKSPNTKDNGWCAHKG